METRSVSLLRQVWLSLWIQSAKIRRTWIFQILIPTLIAFGTVWLGSRIAVVNGMSLDARTRYVTGSAFVAAMFATVNVVTHEISWARASGEIEYFVSSGVRTTALLLSYISLPTLYSIFPVCAVLAAGSVLLGVHPHPSALLPIVLLSGQLLMTCIGGACGLALPRRLAPLIAAALPLVIMMFTPVLVPASALPSALREFGRLLPSTLIVDLMEITLFGQPGPQAVERAVGLFVIAVAVLILVARMREWRGRS
jgi:ABC-type multidrug transport system permease subunit